MNNAGVNSSVHFISFDEKIENWYNISDILVLPSLYEPFGMVALEAMACGVPIIASESSGVTEIVGHGREGLILKDPSNITEFSRALLFLVNDREKRHEMGHNAYLKSKEYSWEMIARKTRKVYEEIINNKD